MWFPQRFAIRKDHWIGKMGNTFIHMHHYCWGLVNLARAQKSNVRLGKQAAGLTDILNDFNYVINAAPPDFILLPEIYTRVGQVELLMKRPNNAKEAFLRARTLKQDYWPAYSYWIEHLIRAGKYSEAKKLIDEGLMYSPNAKVLVEQLRLIDKKSQSK
jgi:tetratricopeptide (TPR) repeat protein